MRVRDEHLDGSRVRSLLGRVSYVLVRDVELVVGYEHGGLYFYDGVVVVAVVVMADETKRCVWRLMRRLSEVVVAMWSEKREKVQRRYSTGSGKVEVQIHTREDALGARYRYTHHTDLSKCKE